MTIYKLTEKIPTEWSEECPHEQDLFNSQEWQDLLSYGFGSKPLYAWNDKAGKGFTITVFKAGLFRIGYISFPVGGRIGSGAVDPAFVSSLTKESFPMKIDSLRIIASPFNENEDLSLPFKVMLETAIEDLQVWCPDADKKLRQDLNRARRAPLIIVDADNSIDAKHIFNLYRETVFRHGGNLRYTKKYFKGLIDFARQHSRIRCLLALAEGDLVGFEVVACHGERAYSLHGCTDARYRQYSTADLLTYEAIAWAKDMGMKQYNLMASQSDRPSLAKYKEKWGGITGEQKTYELNFSPVSMLIFKAGDRVCQKMSKFIKLA